MPTIFERTKIALDALMERAAGFVTGSLDAKVGKQCRRLRLSYEGMLSNSDREPVDYTKPTTQLAYVYRTLPSHSEWMFKALRSASRALQTAESRSPIRVACMGGGPGSDMVGFIKFLEYNDLHDPDVEFVVLDREKSWNTPRRAFLPTFGRNIRERFQYLDMADTDRAWTEDWDFCRADVFTFSFSLSEVWCYNRSGAVTDFLDEVVRRAKRGAIFVYLDNGGECSQAADDVFDAMPSLEIISRQDDDRMRLGTDERRDILEDAYCARFSNERVKMGGNVSIRVWRKR